MAITEEQFIAAKAFKIKDKTRTRTFPLGLSYQKEAEEMILEAKRNHLEVTAVTVDGGTRGFFLHDRSGLCMYNKGSKKSGNQFKAGSYFSPVITSVSIVSQLTDEEKVNQRNKKQIATVEKYRRLAKKSSFSNTYIRKCLNADKLKSPWENRISAGSPNEGEVITVERVRKAMAEHFGEGYAECMIAALNEKKNYTSSRFPFSGYEGSVEIKICEKSGELNGFFSKETIGDLNGYYYELINDKSFIGFEKD